MQMRLPAQLSVIIERTVVFTCARFESQKQLLGVEFPTLHFLITDAGGKGTKELRSFFNALFQCCGGGRGAARPPACRAAANIGASSS